MRRTTLALVMVVVVVASSADAAIAQASRRAGDTLIDSRAVGPTVSLHGGISRGQLTAAFTVDSRGVGDRSECGRYEEGSASGFVIGIEGELPLTSLLGARGMLGLHGRSGSLDYPCVDPAGIHMPDGSVAEARTDFQADVDYRLLSLDLALTLRPLPLPLVASIGPRVALLADAAYSAREVVVTPAEASFVDGGQERPIASGDFESGDVSLALGAALQYEAPIGGRWMLIPRVAGAIALGDEITPAGMRWSGVELTLGIAYRFPAPSHESTPIEPGSPPQR